MPPRLPSRALISCRLLAAAAVGATLAACGGTATNTTTEPTAPAGSGGISSSAQVVPQLADPCSLLTTEEVALVLNRPAVEATGNDDSGERGCVWSVPIDPEGAPDTTNVVLLGVDEAGYTTARDNPAGTEIRVQPVEGLGDDAFFQILSETPDAAHVLLYLTAKGTRLQVAVTGAGFGLEAAQQAERALAEKVIGRL